MVRVSRSTAITDLVVTRDVSAIAELFVFLVKRDLQQIICSFCLRVAVASSNLSLHLRHSSPLRANVQFNWPTAFYAIAITVCIEIVSALYKF